MNSLKEQSLLEWMIKILFSNLLSEFCEDDQKKPHSSIPTYPSKWAIEQYFP